MVPGLILLQYVQLDALWLDRTGAGDEAARALSNARALVGVSSLWLGESTVTEAGCAVLRAALRRLVDLSVSPAPEPPPDTASEAPRHPYVDG